MKLLLSAGDFNSGQEFISFYSSKLSTIFPSFEVRSVGYANQKLNLSLDLNSIFSPVFGTKNKEKIISEIISFSPDLILNWGNYLISKWGKKYNWNIVNCGGFSVFQNIDRKLLPCFVKKIPLPIQKMWFDYGQNSPISFWPFVLNLTRTEKINFPCFPVQKLQTEKGYYFVSDEVKRRIQYWPEVEEEIFLTNGSTNELYLAFQNKFSKIFLFPNSRDPEVICNSFFLEKFNLGSEWKGEEEIKLNLIPKIDYSKINLINDEKNILDFLQEKYF